MRWQWPASDVRFGGHPRGNETSVLSQKPDTLQTHDKPRSSLYHMLLSCYAESYSLSMARSSDRRIRCLFRGVDPIGPWQRG